MSKFQGFTTLQRLLTGIIDQQDVADIQVSGIEIDSRKVGAGDLFIAIDGTNTSGIAFIQDAINQGAVAVLIDADSTIDTDSYGVPVYQVVNVRMVAGIIANRFFGEPSNKMNVTGITGTNGKTSIAYYLAQTLSDYGQYRVGSIGTLGYGTFGDLTPAVNTTPDTVTIHELLAGFVGLGVKDVIMEVSSHALEQGRVSGVSFDTAVFTNLSRDHLDYHNSISAYANAKKKLFAVNGLKNAVINIDDSLGRELSSQLKDKLNLITYGVYSIDVAENESSAHVSAVVRQDKINTLLLDIRSPWGSGELLAPVSGRFNTYNVLATLSVLCLHGIAFDIALQRLARLSGVPGRLELFGNTDSTKIFVDYAHTPDALKQALLSLRSLTRGKLICVFGCGGNRDKGKRPEMGLTAEQYSDHIILTSDNPRTESPEQIIQDIVVGMTESIPVLIEPDRALAIRAAIDFAGPDDIVLIAGKGHETYQEIGTSKIPFSDRQLVRNLLDEKR